MRKLEYTNQLSSNTVDINLSPLIDVVFLLLIFFIVTTVFVDEVGIDIQKPKAVSAEQLDKKSIMIALADSGEIVYGGQAFTLNGIRGIVSQHLHEAQVPVIILADEKSKSGKLVELIDECKLAGANSVSIATNKKK